jgi:hypothetical protein
LFLLRLWHGFLFSAACASVEKCEEAGLAFLEDMRREKVTVTTIDKAMVGWKQGAQATMPPAVSFKVQDSMALLDVDHASM